MGRKKQLLINILIKFGYVLVNDKVKDLSLRGPTRSELRKLDYFSSKAVDEYKKGMDMLEQEYSQVLNDMKTCTSQLQKLSLQDKARILRNQLDLKLEGIERVQQKQKSLHSKKEREKQEMLEHIEKMKRLQACQVWDDGTHYYGNVDERGNRDGPGLLVYPNGDRYEGGFYLNKRSGYGTFTKNNGWTFRGEWKDGFAHGKGSITDEASQQSYEGEFYQGKRQGFGKWKDKANDITYVGSWENDKMHGSMGSLSLPGGDYYVGQWKEGRPHGFGKFVYRGSGNFYEGFWHGGKAVASLLIKDNTERASVIDGYFCATSKPGRSGEMKGGILTGKKIQLENFEGSQEEMELASIIESITDHTSRFSADHRSLLGEDIESDDDSDQERDDTIEEKKNMMDSQVRTNRLEKERRKTLLADLHSIGRHRYVCSTKIAAKVRAKQSYMRFKKIQKATVKLQALCRGRQLRSRLYSEEERRRSLLLFPTASSPNRRNTALSKRK
eukprot:g3400.t1